MPGHPQLHDTLLLLTVSALAMGALFLPVVVTASVYTALLTSVGLRLLAFWRAGRPDSE